MQGREIIHRVAYGAPLPALDEAIKNSTWNERGWTYQESILSRRMIVYTNSQMHFKCIHGCTACEETWEDEFRDIKKMSDLPNEQRLESYQPKMLTGKAVTDVHYGGNNSLGWWYQHVREMCYRKTTEAKDRLHALEGILQYLRSMFDNHDFV